MFEIKVIELEDRAKGRHESHPTMKASHAARSLHASLHNHADNYFNNPTNEESMQKFKHLCNQAIQEAKLTLDQHRGWGKILRDLAFFITSIVTVGIANVISYAINRDLRFFKVPITDSVMKVERMHHYLNLIIDVSI